MGRFAVGTGSIGSKALTVVGVIDFLGAGTVHNYFTQGAGNNMQINTNVDEANAVGDPSRSQWKLVLGSSLDWFSIRRSPAGGTYNEDALFFIQGSTGNVGIATVDTANGAAIPFSPSARLHVETASGDAIWGVSTATSGATYGVYGQSDSSVGTGVFGRASSGTGVWGAGDGVGVVGNGWVGVYGEGDPETGQGVRGYGAIGVYGETDTMNSYGIFGVAWVGGAGVYGYTSSTDGYGVYGNSAAEAGTSYGVYGSSRSPDGYGVYGSGPWHALGGYATGTTGTNFGVYGQTASPDGFGVFSLGDLTAIGDFTATGTKSAIVETQDFAWRTLYTIESPQNWFEDFGQGTLVAGEAVVPIEPVFAQTVNLSQPYHVFLTPRGGFCSLYLAETSPTAFTVRALEGAGCEIVFDYRIVAPRLGYENLRLEPAEDPEAVAASLPAAPSAPAAP
jgi:hypothetical protein